MPLKNKQNELSHFTGTEHYYRLGSIFPRMLMTDGAKFVADHGGTSGAYWLMQAIASHQPQALKNKRLQEFQIWKLVVKADKTAELTCWADTGKGQKPKITQAIEYCDFDLDEIQLYCGPLDETNRVIYLPSEY